MKVCAECGQQHEDDAPVCGACGHYRFEPAKPPEADSSPPPAQPDLLTTEREGALTVLKCRTPEEACLVAKELEAADILVSLPDDEALEEEFQSRGFVSLRVSAESYAAAKELQAAIEPKEWQERARMPLSWPMVIAAVGLGLLSCAGIIGLIFIHDVLTKKGYTRQASSLGKWFTVGFAISSVVLAVISNRDF